MPPTSVRIQTGSRLHFGPLSHRPRRGRHFGGIGMMVESPGFSLTIRQSESLGSSESELVDNLLERIQKNRPEWELPVTVDIQESIPPHEGFGSGTQLGMAVTEGIGLLHGETDLTAKRLASYSRRGQRSSVGLFGYLEGGFLVDAGHQAGESIGQIACRFDFPEDWNIILLTPAQSPGLHGADEVSIFASLAPMRESLTGRLSHLTLTEILPSLKHGDFKAFAPAISTYGKLVGEFFASSQGGVFAHPEMEAFVDRFYDKGIRALAQSSWGPTIALFAPNEEETQRICDAVQEDEFGKTCSLKVSKALNSGRKVHIE